MTLAARSSVTAADLIDVFGANWSSEKASRPEAGLECPGYRPDFSGFTITGYAETDFSNKPKFVAVGTEVFESNSMASKDFALADVPAFAPCLAATLRGSIISAGARSARVALAGCIDQPGFAATLPGGGRVTWCTVTFKLRPPNNGEPYEMYEDSYFIVRGRTIGEIDFLSTSTEFRFSLDRQHAMQRTLLARMAERLR